MSNLEQAARQALNALGWHYQQRHAIADSRIAVDRQAISDLIAALAQQAEPAMVRCPRCWEPMFAPKGQAEPVDNALTKPARVVDKEQAEPAAMSASGMTKEAAFINGKLYHIDPRQAQWIEDRIRAVQAEPHKPATDAADGQFMSHDGDASY
jgi:hypothetical protein